MNLEMLMSQENGALEHFVTKKEGGGHFLQSWYTPSGQVVLARLYHFTVQMTNCVFELGANWVIELKVLLI